MWNRLHKGGNIDLTDVLDSSCPCSKKTTVHRSTTITGGVHSDLISVMSSWSHLHCPKTSNHDFHFVTWLQYDTVEYISPLNICPPEVDTKSRQHIHNQWLIWIHTFLFPSLSHMFLYSHAHTHDRSSPHPLTFHFSVFSFQIWSLPSSEMLIGCVREWSKERNNC